jgi:photosystem II stability/assembly factor-like uncharacterized protein
MKKIFLVSIIFSFISFVAYAQGFHKIMETARQGENFISIANKVNDFFKPLSKAQRKIEGYNLWKRWEYYAMSHLDNTGNIGNSAQYNHTAIELEKNRRVARSGDPANNNLLNGEWTPLGPTGIQAPSPNYLGRVNCMAFHPTNANVIYAGTPDGGLWVSYNGGGFWFPLTDGLPTSAISGIVVHPTNPSIIYILTGDGDASISINYFHKRGAGVYKTTDGGTTWSITGLNFLLSEGILGFELVMCPTNSNVLLAATSNGIYKTSNAGATWNRETFNSVSSIRFKANDPTKVIAVELNDNNLIRSSDTGNVWIACPVFALPNGNFYRAELAVSPANPDVAYAVAWKFTNFYQGLHTYNWATNTVSVLNTTPNILGRQAWYNLALWVSPTDGNQISAAGTTIFRSTTAGASFFADQDIVHADIHGYYYNNLDNKLYVVCDGGILYSTNNGDTWTNITNNLQITEYYRISGVDSNPDIMLGGTQDNGHHLRTTNSSTFQWKITCCDGMDNAIEQSNPNIMYGFTQNGQINKSIDAGATFVWIPPTIMDTLGEPWVTDFLIHPTTPATIFYGGRNGVLRHTSRGEPTNAWVNIIGARSAIDMAISASNPNRLYAADRDSVFRTDNVNAAIPTWIGYRPLILPSVSFITSIDVDPDNAAEVWITVSGYNAATKVYRSITSGATWTNETDNLPNIPVHVIKFQDTNGSPGGAVYIGTDIGVYYRDNTMSEWMYFSNNLPSTTVLDLEINETSGLITAATFGRGMWRSPTYLASCYSDINITSPINGIEYQQATNTITMSTDVYGGVGTRVMLKAGGSVTFTVGTDVLSGNELKAFIGPCANDNPVFRQVNSVLKKDSLFAVPNK